MTTIHLPWPPTATNPNASGSGNWRKKAKAARSYKSLCVAACIDQSVQKMDAVGDVEVIVTYHPPANNRMDWDNAANRCKQGWDAVADALGVDDGRWWPVHSHKGAKVKDGKVTVQFITEKGGK